MLLTPLQYIKSLDKKSLRFLFFWMGVSLVLHIFASVYSIGFQYFDEHFQILEFAALKLGWTKPEILPWEYPAQIRPTIQPAFAYFYIKLLNLDDPFFIAFVGRFISGILGWFSTFFFTLCVIQWVNSERLRKFLVVLTAMLWFMPYVHVRFSSESWSGSLFFIGLGIFLISQTKQLKISAYREVMYLCAAGFLLGLAYVFRLQTAIMYPGIFLWGLLVARISFPKLFAMGIALLAAIGIGVLFDRWFYGEWVNTAWNYFEKNILEDKASQFGVSPWWFYFTETYKKALAPFSLILVLGFITAFIRYPRNVLTWAIVPFIIIHSLIGHKELRFFFPIVNAVPILLVLAVDGIGKQYWQQVPVWARKAGKWLLIIFWIFNAAFLVGANIQPAEPSMGIYKHINDKYRKNRTPLAVVAYKWDTYKRLADLYMMFYMYPELKTYKANNTAELQQIIDTSTIPVLFFSDIKGFEKPTVLDSVKVNYKPEYYSMPLWYRKVDFNGWVSRTSNWVLYNVRQDLSEGHPDLREKFGQF